MSDNNHEHSSFDNQSDANVFINNQEAITFHHVIHIFFISLTTLLKIKLITLIV